MSIPSQDKPQSSDVALGMSSTSLPAKRNPTSKSVPSSRPSATDVSNGYGTLPTRPDILRAAPKPTDLLRALQRRWLLALCVGLLLSVPGAITAWYVIPVTYTADAWLQARSPRLLYSVNETQDSLKMHAQLLKNFFVLDAAIGKPGIAKLPWIRDRDRAGKDVTQWLASQISVAMPGGRRRTANQGLIRISMTGDDPGQLQKLVSAVMEAYLDRVVNAEKTRALARRDTLRTVYSKKSEDLRKKRTAINELAGRIGTSDEQLAAAQRQLLTDYIHRLRGEIGSVKWKVRGKEREIRAFKIQYPNFDADSAKIPEQYIEEHVLSDVQLRHLDGLWRQEKERRDDVLKIIINPKESPTLRAIEENIAKLEKEMNERYAGLLQDIEKRHQKGLIPNPVRDTFEMLQRELEELTFEYEELSEQYRTSSADVKELRTNTADLAKMKDDMGHLASVTKKVGMELEKLQLEASSIRDRIVPLQDKITIPKVPDTAKRDKMVGMASVGGFLLAIAAISLFEFQARRITTSEEMEEGLGVRFLGTVPMLSDRKWRKRRINGVPVDVQMMMDESMDAIRSMLLHAPGTNSICTVLIGSARDGEGKTTVAGSLAASLGRTGRRTLLVDGDLRSPSAHLLFDMPVDPGFADVLRGDAAIEDVVQPSQATGLWVMTAGLCDNLSLQAMTREGAAHVFEQLKSEFDYVVVDSGPILAVVDPLLLGQYCDGAVLSVVRGVSQISSVYEACERMRSTGIQLMGCVVNGIPGKTMGASYYGYGYGYGYTNTYPEEAEVEEAEFEAS